MGSVSTILFLPEYDTRSLVHDLVLNLVGAQNSEHKPDRMRQNNKFFMKSSLDPGVDERQKAHPLPQSGTASPRDHCANVTAKKIHVPTLLGYQKDLEQDRRHENHI